MGDGGMGSWARCSRGKMPYVARWLTWHYALRGMMLRGAFLTTAALMHDQLHVGLRGLTWHYVDPLHGVLKAP